MAFDGGVQRGTEGPQIARGRSVSPLKLFGWHVLRCADDGPGCGETGPGRTVQHACDSEVGDDRTASDDQHIVRLQVAVHDSGRMGMRESVCHCRCQRHDLRPRQPTVSGNQVGERVTRDEFHDDPGFLAIPHHVVNGDDAGVAELGSYLGFSQRSLQQ
ncbi:hypothetical protein IQ62_27470 [Streptomyces scabiei]|nr:hypothetical protein IQ62_27470 [Streptomyces scabiei]